MNIFEEDIIAKDYDARLMKRFLGYLRPYRGLILITFILIFGSIAVELAGPLIIREVIDGPVKNKDINVLLFWTVLFLLSITLGGVLQFLYIFLTNVAGQKIIFDIRRELFKHIQNLPTIFFDRNPVGRLVVRATNDVESLTELFTSGLVSFLADLFIIAGVIIIMFTINVKLSLVTLSISPFVVAIVLVFRRLMRDKFREIRRKIARLNAYLNECVQGVRLIRLFTRQRYCFDKFRAKNQDFCAETLGSVFLYSLLLPVMEFISIVSVALIVWYGGLSILQGTLSFGSFVAFWYCVSKIFDPLRDLAEKYNIMQSAMASSERIFKILDTPAEENPGSKLLKEPAGRIEFQDVTFSYDGQINVLENVSFSIEAGQKVALVGLTGAGKTTLINLLTRMYELKYGRILLDGVDIREYDLYMLRRLFGAVPQDVFLFSGGVESNIRLNEDSNQQTIQHVVDRAGLSAVIAKLPEGMKTDIKTRGIGLSQGERQLISFARALYHNPRIIILDEATSSIDTYTESLLQGAMKKLTQGRSSLIIAHRFSTLKDVDKVVVLHKGRVHEEGSHETLFNKKGLYYKLCMLQMGEPN